ncbi:MAG: catechol 2,3-dioxygenase [Alphaproteobacteria bacterium]|nr:catechol 2,3-dioxygenase [Alphaproteobacteria bacterium]
MAITGVLRPGHAQVRVLNLEEDVKFYRDVLGLVEMGRDGQGRVYFKAWDERDHHSLVLRQADRAGLDIFAFKVDSVATLNKLEKDLNAYGVATRRIPAGEMLHTGERVSFVLPCGHNIELYAEKKDVGNGLPYSNPDPWCKAADTGMAPTRMDHALLGGVELDGARDIFMNVLGFYMTEEVVAEDGKTQIAIWLSCSNKNHDIAFVRAPENGMLHHVSYFIETWERVLRAADLMSMNKVPVDIGPTRHGITRGATIYAFDRSGNRFETFSGGYIAYPDMHKLTWPLDTLPEGLDFPQRKLHESFLTVFT